jgi:hypothetical protein
MPAANPIIGMNLSSSQTELVQSWGLGHSGQFSESKNLQLFAFENFQNQTNLQLWVSEKNSESNNL